MLGSVTGGPIRWLALRWYRSSPGKVLRRFAGVPAASPESSRTAQRPRRRDLAVWISVPVERVDERAMGARAIGTPRDRFPAAARRHRPRPGERRFHGRPDALPLALDPGGRHRRGGRLRDLRSRTPPPWS